MDKELYVIGEKKECPQIKVCLARWEGAERVWKGKFQSISKSIDDAHSKINLIGEISNSLTKLSTLMETEMDRRKENDESMKIMSDGISKMTSAIEIVYFRMQEQDDKFESLQESLTLKQDFDQFKITTEQEVKDLKKELNEERVNSTIPLKNVIIGGVIFLLGILSPIVVEVIKKTIGL